MNTSVLLVILLSIDLCFGACDLVWVATDHDIIPTSAVIGNTGNDLGDFYPSRAVQNGVLTPGRYKPAEAKCFITMDGVEYAIDTGFEVLTNPNNCILEWKAAHDGTIPAGAVEGGDDISGGTRAYVARTNANGGYMVGKFYPSASQMYYGWGGAEYGNPSYELLANVDTPSDNTIRPDCANNKQDHNSFACVCTEGQPCDRLEGPVKTDPNVITKWESTRLGSRLKKQSLAFPPKGAPLKSRNASTSDISIRLDRGVQYQTILGFGGAFTDATGINIKKLSEAHQDHLINDLFSADGLEYNLGRIPIGGCDFSTRGYSLDDVEEDKTLDQFALAPEDLDYKIPIILKAKAVATHDIRFYGSPWSAPKWMKDNNDYVYCGAIKGDIGTEYWQIWAKYYVKYLNAYKDNGIEHWGITIQNEPYACVPWNSMWYSPDTMREFLVTTLGPELANSGYGPDKLNVMVLDHNVGLVAEWVTGTFSDPEASRLAAGTAIHWYGHDPKEMLDAPHDQHPDKFILATEACVEGAPKIGDWYLADIYASDILGDLLHHVVGWTDWNMALDMQGGPNWVNNFVDAPIIVNPDANEYYRQPSYYALAHFSKFLPPGSVRVDTPIVSKTNNNALIGAFRTPEPDSSTVVIVVNSEDIDIDIVVDDTVRGQWTTTVGPRSIQTYVYYD